MKKKVVLITGASHGIGSATARIFAKNNYDVIINYNNSKDSALALQKDIEHSYNVTVKTIKCDISLEEEVKKMFDFVLETFGRIDVLVNNAGIAIDTTIEDKQVNNFKRILDVNLLGTFLVSRIVGDFMKKQGFGSIVNISSTNAIDTYYPFSIDYDASKAGIISLTHNFAKYYAPIVKVNCIAPGWIDTNMNKDLDANFKINEISKILLNRFGGASEVAEAIYFVSNASYINNEVIRVDGGFDGNK